MTPSLEEVRVVASAALALMMVGALALWRLPGECVCRQCSFHRREREERAEADRLRRHRELHRTYNIPWEKGRCSVCEGGGLGDKPD
jgi:hypothetical protein